MKCTTQPWSIGKLWLQKNRINIDPPYQRESGAWSDEKKQLFMDSILNGYDVPKLYFHDIQAKKEPFGFAAIDGKQRLGAIWDFMANAFALAEDFAFSGDTSFLGDSGPPAPGIKFSDLSVEQQEYFRSQTIDVVEVSDADEEDIEELFSRLNNGEPLNAAEKRNAMGGEMSKLIREIAKDQSLGVLLKFQNRRMSYQEVAAKLIRLELNHQQGQGLYADLKKRHLDELVKKNKNLNPSEYEGLKVRVSKNIKELLKVFGSQSALMGKQSFPQLYYPWVKAIKADYAHAALDAKIGAFLEEFHRRRIENLQLPEDQRDSTLIEFGRLMQQGTNDIQSMSDKARTLTRYFLQYVPDVEVKDQKRLFGEDERYVIWLRAGKICQADGCGKALSDIDEMHADHTTAWANGGKTVLANAKAMCEPCNLKKGSK